MGCVNSIIDSSTSRAHPALVINIAFIDRDKRRVTEKIKRDFGITRRDPDQIR